MHNRAGFSLLDLLISMAIFAVISIAFVAIFVVVVNIQGYENSQTDAAQQSQFLIQQVQYYIESARLADMPLDTATGTLTLRMPTAAIDPTVISVASGTVYLTQGTGTAQALTSNLVNISSMSFTRHRNVASSSAYGAESVSFSFGISENASNTKKSFLENFQLSASVLRPVPSIALLQQAKMENSGPVSGGVSVTFGNNNETSSLLIAVAANTTSSASVSVSDSAGNTWTKIASATYPAYNEAINVFAALNAKNSSNTVTAAFGFGAGYTGLFIYEYRGASTSSSFDASSSQLNPATQTPSSGMASPATSTSELLFGVIFNGSTAEVPSAGPGYTLETTGTVTHVFVEDMSQYITGPIDAPWRYVGAAPSSSALIATFR